MSIGSEKYEQKWMILISIQNEDIKVLTRKYMETGY